MSDTLTRLPAGDHGDCTGCDHVIRAAQARGERPPARGQSSWALSRGPEKIYWLCLNCAARAAHTHGITCAMNPTGAKTIAQTLVPTTPKE